MPVKKFKDPSLITTSTEKQRNRTGSVKPKSLGAPNLPAATKELPPQSTHQTGNTLQTQIAGGPLVNPATYNKEVLKNSWNNLSGRTMEWLLQKDHKTGLPRLEMMLQETKLKDIGVLLGIATEKVLLMEGHVLPTMGHDEKKKLDEFLPEIMKEIQRRGALVQVTERKAEIKLNGK